MWVSPVLRSLWMTLLSILLLVEFAGAQTTGQLHVDPAPDLSGWTGQPLDEVRVQSVGQLWGTKIAVQSVRPGDIVSGELVRRAMRELDRSGNFADLRAELIHDAGRNVLILWVEPRRLVHQVRWSGGTLERSDEERALNLRPGDAVTEAGLKRATRALTELYQSAGYREAEIQIVAEDVDDPRRTLLRVNIQEGPPTLIRTLRFEVAPSPHHPKLGEVLRKFGLSEGDRLDNESITLASEELQAELVAHRFYEAEVSHEVRAGDELVMRVRSGPFFRFRFEGNENFGAAELLRQMELEKHRDPRPEVLQDLLRKFYHKQGFLDAHVQVTRLNDERGLVSELVVWVQSGRVFQISERSFPCLGDSRSQRSLNDEIDGVLNEQFPAAAFLGPAPSEVTDPHMAEQGFAQRPMGPLNRPWRNYSKDSYRKVVEHLSDLYHADGYLDAVVGPATIVRARCAPESPPGECIALPAPQIETSCELQKEVETPVIETCVPDFSAGVRCSADAQLILPIVEGPQAILYDVDLEGNHFFTEQQLLKWADLPLGKPLRREAIDRSLRRIEERYLNEAFAFVQLDSEIELSGDHTRARLVISIVERQRVRISRIDVRGATETSESLIRSRLSLHAGQLYKRSRVVRSQEQLESLGVFTSVTISLADPGVPAREKVVLVMVTERLPQYLDTKVGFASADGFRMAFEYGHRNLGGQAIRLTLRSQLSLRPLFLITESDVRRKYEELSLLQLLERRNTITVGFPNVGLGPLFSFEAELLDLRANERDFSHSRDAAVLRMLFRPRRQYLMSVGGTVELNNATILGGESLQEYVQNNPNANIRVPEGQSIAYTQNLGGSWDRRDQPLSATRGTYLGLTVEHVTAVPLGQSEGTCNENTDKVFAPVCSELLRFSGKLAGYVPFNKKGLSLAVSLHGGVIQHLTKISRTYPDRLFFMGGVDTLRGYTQYSLVPQDLADQVLSDDQLTIDEVVLRGGDIFINPRVELRIPLSPNIQTALFVDAGNLWQDRSLFNPLQLRYTTGTGLRIKTPVGPLVFDYGFNIDRVLDGIFGENSRSRTWEDIGAFHFSIGLF